MLEGLLGIRMVLLMGKTLPLPVPYEVASALLRAEVSNDTDDPGDGFSLTFALSKSKTLEYDLLESGALEPFNRVVIGVFLGVVPEVLIDGVITKVSLSPSVDPGASTVTVQGKDVTLMLNLEEKLASYENQPDFVIFTQIVGQYAQYGLIPTPTPTPDIPLIIQRIPRQRETDLAYIQRLAQRNGFVFYTQPLPFGTSIAYFGPENRVGLPQPALTMNMGSYDNLKTIQVANDSLAPVASQGTVLEPITKTAIPIPSLPSLRVPPLAASPEQPRRTIVLADAANRNPGEAATSIIAANSRAAEAVSLSGEVDTIRYGSILRARQIVGVRGIGTSYNGNYYVRSVRHAIERGSYTQSFRLSREGTGSLLPVVRP